MRWIATKEGKKKEIVFIAASECKNAEDALRYFSSHCACHFDIYFRTEDGVLHQTEAESTVEDFR
jgi:hypothetical protein